MLLIAMQTSETYIRRNFLNFCYSLNKSLHVLFNCTAKVTTNMDTVIVICWFPKTCGDEPRIYQPFHAEYLLKPKANIFNCLQDIGNAYGNLRVSYIIEFTRSPPEKAVCACNQNTKFVSDICGWIPLCPIIYVIWRVACISLTLGRKMEISGDEWLGEHRRNASQI